MPNIRQIIRDHQHDMLSPSGLPATWIDLIEGFWQIMVTGVLMQTCSSRKGNR
jgi:hypothetical protein